MKNSSLTDWVLKGRMNSTHVVGVIGLKDPIAQAIEFEVFTWFYSHKIHVHQEINESWVTKK